MSGAPTRSASTSEHDATEQREGARALLATPILTAGRHPEALALVRRQARPLKAMFASTTGYQLVVESTFARLHKGPLDQDTPPRPVPRVTAGYFAPRTYTYLALLCAGLLTTPPRDQVLIGSLVNQVRADAAIAGITIDDTATDRRHLVHAILYLVELGVLTETDSTVAAWRDRQIEGLLDVHRPLLPHLLTLSLQDLTGPGPLLDGSAHERFGPDQPRRSLRRKLVENPLVRREDLSDLERDVLSRERTELTNVLDVLFGLTLEVRLEGALCYDTDDELSDVSFPGEGTTAWVALLLVNALVDELKVVPSSTAELDGRTVPGALAPWDMVDAAVELLIERYGPSFGVAHVADPPALRAGAVALLEAVSVARSTDAGLLLHPVSARYQPEPNQIPANRPVRPAAADPPGDMFAGTLFDPPAVATVGGDAPQYDTHHEATTDLETS
jgi:uncharacterized protein (TIGR02678 family)